MKVKHAFKVFLSWIFVKVKAGPLTGRKWIITSGAKYLRGTQEVYKTEAFIKNFKKGEILFDIGAHVGYFSAMAALINDGTGGVFAFEPRPMNARFFRKHMKKNNFQNVTLFEAAVGDSEKDVKFDTGHGSATGHVSTRGRMKVKQVSIDNMIKKGILPFPDFIKIDVEGGEIEVLKGLTEIISIHHPKILVATHNNECHNYTMDFLKRNNYKIEILNPGYLKGDTEIVALPEVNV
jgi:FkbM family methyltransferase